MDEITWWDTWNSSYRNADCHDAVSDELFVRAAEVVNEMTKTAGGRILEVACGSGALSRLLKYSSYHGLDISPAAIQVAQQKSEHIQPVAASSFPTYEAADFHEWPAPVQPFDVVVCVDAVSCFRDPQRALTKISHCLRTSGVLVLTTINPFVYRRIRRTQASPLESGPVSRWFSPRELHALIESAGLKVERSYTMMPRGNGGILRLVNARRLNQAFGPRGAAVLRRLKEQAGLGQYRLVVGRKQGPI